MLFIPYFAKSLLGDGLVSAAAGMAAAPLMMATGGAKAYLTKQTKSGMNFANQRAFKPLWKGTGGLAMRESKNAFHFASELGRVNKATGYTKEKLKGAKSHILEGRKVTADFIRRSTGLKPKHKDLPKTEPELPKNVIKLNFKKGDD